MATLKASQRRIEPAENAFSITPSDVANLEQVTRAISTADAADLDVTMAGGQRVTITVAAGVLHPLAVVKVWDAGTTATGIVGYY
jgi:hypothetical protein